MEEEYLICKPFPPTVAAQPSPLHTPLLVTFLHMHLPPHVVSAEPGVEPRMRRCNISIINDLRPPYITVIGYNSRALKEQISPAYLLGGGPNRDKRLIDASRHLSSGDIV